MKKVKHSGENKKNALSKNKNYQKGVNNITDKKEGNFLDTFAPKDYLFQIYLVVAVTAIVIICIFSVGKKTSNNGGVSQFEIPIHTRQYRYSL